MTATGTRNARALQRMETRQRILRAGLALVGDLGVSGATTAAIAGATGTAHGTIFVHFKTRDDLVSELVEQLGRAITDRLDEAEPSPLTLPEVLAAHLDALRTVEAPYSRILGEVRALPDAARAHLLAFQSGVAWRLSKAYRQACRPDRPLPHDPTLVSNTWLALVNHYLVNRDLFAPGCSVIDSHGDILKNHLLSLLKLEHRNA